jgi:Domain of unknown function (DUF222)/HNH endonuclease
MCSLFVDGRSDGPRPLELLERELVEGASAIHAATCRWLMALAEYDARAGWAQWGCRSCAHWVSWQCGISPGAAREHVRVARRLVELPLICVAFLAGELSYSKVRALTRVENVEREQELLELALDATAARLERLLRAYRGVVAAERAAAGGRPQRWVAFEHDDDGALLLRARLPAEEGALVLEALQAACDQLDTQDVPAGTATGDTDAASDVPAGTPDDQPAGGHLTADVPAGTPKLSASEARADALVAVADAYLAGNHGSRSGGERYQVLVHVDSSTLAGDGSTGRCELDDGASLAAETARRLACDASLVRVIERDGRPLSLGRKTRSIPPALRRALHTRDRGCRFPGCGSRRFVDAHHIEHWADGGATDLSNLVVLCGHHHRLVHGGGYTITKQPGGRLAFHRPDGRTIPACPGAPPGRPAPLARTRRPDACVPRCNDPLHLDLAVDAMLTIAPVATGEPPGI